MSRLKPRPTKPNCAVTWKPVGHRRTKAWGREPPNFMPVVTIQDVGRHDGQEVTLRGWLYNLRESGKLLFPIFRDGTGTIQGIVPKAAVPPEVFERVRGLTQESSVIV